MNLEQLTGRYLEGQATAEEVAQLEQLLLAQPQCRRQFAELANLDSALAELAAGEDVLEAPIRPARAMRSAPRVAFRFAALAAVLGLLLSGLWWQAESRHPHAIVARGIGIDSFSSGMKIGNAAYDIPVGTVEFITALGARVVIEAPAAFRFESSQRLRLLHGRVAADVPPSAKGFTVLTPTGNAIDLGTKFGVDVPVQGQAEIHVFQGEVIAQSSGGGQRTSLKDGEAYSLQSGAGASRDIRSGAFIQPDETQALLAGFAAGQRARSEEALTALRRDPDLITLLDFEQSSLPEGTFRITQGRWPGSRAPEFVNLGDHMKINAGAGRSWPQLTLAAWVRLDRLNAHYHSLYHTDGWDDNKPGQVHWILNHDTTMRLALKHNTLAPGSTETHGFPDSLTPVLPEQGRWLHLAAVYDSLAGTVRFYVNGRFDKETRQAIAHPALLGPAQVGNWNAYDRKLSGRLDELLLLGRIMTDAEIRDMYTAGNPYR